MSATLVDITRAEFEAHTVDVLDRDERVIGQKQITARCKRCERSIEARWRRTLYWEVASPAGVEHLAADMGQTVCGIDATGDGWWWAL